LPGGFHHVKQSLRVVEKLERGGEGLNLTHEVRDGILKHSKGKGAIFSDNPNLTAMTLEGQIVRIADICAYVNHDFDDAMRAGLVHESELPAVVVQRMGKTHGQRIESLIVDLVDNSRFEDKRMIRMSEPVLEALYVMRDFLYARVYESPGVSREFEKAQRIVEELWNYFHEHADEFVAHHWPRAVATDEGLDRAIGDFICGMTDRYAMRLYQELRLPKPWTVY
jgi:dGTPase